MGRPALAAILLALLGLTIGGAYVAFGAEKTHKPRIASGPAKQTNQTSAAFAYTSKSEVMFLCSLDGAPFSLCGTGSGGSESYAGPLAPGRHAFRVEAQSGVWTSEPSVWRWTIDTTPPPPPSFVRRPGNPTTSKTAKFKYRDSEREVKFLCKLDGASYARCGGSARYKNLGQGWHTFCALAMDNAGNVSTETCFTWRIGAGAAAFTIAGGPLAGSLLYPGGPAVEINLAFTNANTTPITIQSATVSVSGTSVDGCAAANFTVVQQFTATPTVPGSSTKSLQDLGVPQNSWPKLRMIAGGDQDVCQNATVELTYSGTATG